jgi:hypothetical protein
MQGGVSGGYTPPVPMRRSNTSSCLIWGLVGCGALVVIGVVFGVVFVSRASKSGFMKDMMGSMQAMPECSRKLAGVKTALDSYESDHKGKYPGSLNDLIPKYLPDKSDLTCGSTAGSAITAEYAPPKSNTAADAPVVSFYTGTTNISFGRSQSITYYVRLLRNGRIVMDQIQRTDLSQAGSGRKNRVSE